MPRSSRYFVLSAMNFDDLTLEQAQRSLSLKWNYYDRDVIPSWIADMDYPVADPLRDLLYTIARGSELGYAPTMQQERLDEIFAARMDSRYGWSLDPGGCDDMTDIVQAIHIAVTVLCDDDQQVIVQMPSYHPILNACRSMKRDILASPMVKTGQGWEMDMDRLEEEIQPRTRLLMLVNPHNPTGRAFRRDELERLGEMVLRHDLWVVSDEIHCDLVYSDAGPHIPFASLSPGIARKTVTFNSATKSHNLGGVRCALAHYGSTELRKRFDRLPPGIRGGSNTVGHRATRIAWEQCDEWLEYTRDYLQKNRDYLDSYLKTELPEFDHRLNEATFLAWLDCRGLGLKEDPAAFFLREARVGCYAGPLFGEQGKGCIRLNFATSRAILKEKLDRMTRAVRGV